MDPSPVQAPPPPHDVAVKTEERARPIPALQTTQQQQVLPQSQRGGPRYKDKFQTLRDRYESVTATHTEYSRAVQRATEKEQRLQAEINMLLDAALASAPQTQSTSTPAPSTTTPTPVHAQPSPLPLDPQVPPFPLPPPSGHSYSHSQPQADAGNGLAAPHAHTNGHASSLAAPHGHPHSHAHGHGHAHAYPANHGPSTRAPGSSVHGIPNEGGGTT